MICCPLQMDYTRGYHLSRWSYFAETTSWWLMHAFHKHLVQSRGMWQNNFEFLYLAPCTWAITESERVGMMHYILGGVSYPACSSVVFGKNGLFWELCLHDLFRNFSGKQVSKWNIRIESKLCSIISTTVHPSILIISVGFIFNSTKIIVIILIHHHQFSPN